MTDEREWYESLPKCMECGVPITGKERHWEGRRMCNNCYRRVRERALAKEDWDNREV